MKRNGPEEAEADGDGEELVAGNPETRNWRGIGVALLTILTICSIITTAVVLLTPGPPKPKFSGVPITLDEVLSKNLSGTLSVVKWLAGNTLTYVNENGSLIGLEVNNNYKETVLLDRQTLRESDNKPDRWFISPSKKYAALGYSQNRLYRQSSFDLFNISSIEDGVPQHTVAVVPAKNQPGKTRLFSWNPVNDSYVYVYKNDLFYVPSPGDKSVFQQLTFSNSEDIFNGVPDWIYEEEILASDSALWWSADGNYLVFATFNDSNVPKYQYQNYRSPGETEEIIRYAYPRVNEPLPTVKLNYWKTSDSKTKPRPFKMPDMSFNMSAGHYLYSVSWMSNAKEPAIIATWTDRAQRNVNILICSVLSGNCDKAYEIPPPSAQTGWFEPDQFHHDVSSQSSFFGIQPRRVSEELGFFNHLVMFSQVSGKWRESVFLTSGEWEVTKVVAFDEASDSVFFLAAYPLARQRNLLRVRIEGNTTVECLSCSLAKINCTYVDVEFSKEDDHFALSCLGPAVPKLYLGCVSENLTQLVLDNNTRLSQYMAEKKAMPNVYYKTMRIAGQYDVDIKLLLPPGFHYPPRSDEEEENKDNFPMVLNVYAGPNSQQISDKYVVGFQEYLATQKRFVVAYVDGRGSGFRGSRLRSPLYRNFGTVEIADQINATKYLQSDEFMFIQSMKVGVWGWSYGGFAAAHLVQQGGPEVFKCAASVAPVTNFRFYDAAYTERYMGLATVNDNLNGYVKTDVTMKNSMPNVTAFGSVRYLLAHGTGDDNVHFENSAYLVEALDRQSVQFKFLMYPNDQHDIKTGSRHLYSALDDFFSGCFA